MSTFIEPGVFDGAFILTIKKKNGRLATCWNSEIAGAVARSSRRMTNQLFFIRRIPAIKGRVIVSVVITFSRDHYRRHLFTLRSLKNYSIQ